MGRSARSALVALFAFAGVTGSTFSQTVWHVDIHGTPPGNGTLASPYTRIQYAIRQGTTVDGDTVYVSPGTYFENVDFLGKAITVLSVAGSQNTVIDAGDTGSVVSFVSGEGPGSILEGFRIQHGAGTDCCPFVKGGGIYCVGSSPTLLRLVVAENRAILGGGVYLENSSPTIHQCTIRDNVHHNYNDAGLARGIGIYADCTSAPTVTDSSLVHNLYGNYGGGIHGGGRFLSCTITGNVATFGGGAYANDCDLEFQDCMLFGNAAGSLEADSGLGGGTFGGVLTNCTLRGNEGGYRGGGAYQATLVGCTVEDNSASGSPTPGPFDPAMGGGTAECDLVDCNVYGNSTGFDLGFIVVAGNGGGVAGGTARNCRIHHNTSIVTGACPGCPGQAGFGGGGSFDAGLVDCDVHDNTVEDPGSPTSYPAGGGIFGGSARRCRIWQNRATYGGGAANAVLESCTLHGNVATGAGGGLAAIVGGTARAHNSILWGDSAPETALPSTGSLTVDYSDVQGAAAGTGNIDADPLLWAPFSGDFHLKVGSPCIDAGDPASPLDPDNSRIDMGAIPFLAGHCGTPGPYCVAKTNSLGCIPEIGSTGSPSVSGPDNFHVTAALELNRKNGLLFWGRLARNPPYLGGNACVRGALVRTGVQNSGGSAPPAQDCTGGYDFHFSQAYMAAHAIGAFDTIYAQWFSRDPAHPDGTARNYSDALEFTVCP